MTKPTVTLDPQATLIQAQTDCEALATAVEQLQALAAHAIPAVERAKGTDEIYDDGLTILAGLARAQSAFGYLPKQMRGLAQHLSPDRLSPES